MQKKKVRKMEWKIYTDCTTHKMHGCYKKKKKGQIYFYLQRAKKQPILLCSHINRKTTVNDQGCTSSIQERWRAYRITNTNVAAEKMRKQLEKLERS